MSRISWKSTKPYSGYPLHTSRNILYETLQLNYGILGFTLLCHKPIEQEIHHSLIFPREVSEKKKTINLPSPPLLLSFPSLPSPPPFLSLPFPPPFSSLIYVFHSFCWQYKKKIETGLGCFTYRKWLAMMLKTYLWWHSGTGKLMASFPPPTSAARRGVACKKQSWLAHRLLIQLTLA